MFVCFKLNKKTSIGLTGDFKILGNITEEFKGKLLKSLADTIWYEDNIKSVVAVDTPVKDTSLWLTNIENDIVWGENDMPLSMCISCEIFDSGKPYDGVVFKTSKAIVNSVLK